MVSHIRNQSRSNSLDRRNIGISASGSKIVHRLQFVEHSNSEIYDNNNLFNVKGELHASKSVTTNEFDRYLLDRDHRFYRRRIKSHRYEDQIDNDDALLSRPFQPLINDKSSILSGKANAKFINRVLSSADSQNVLKSGIVVGDESVVVHSRVGDKGVSNLLKNESLTSNQKESLHMNSRNTSPTAINTQQDTAIYIPISDSSYGVVDVKNLDVFDRLCLRSNVHLYRRSNSRDSSDSRSARSASPVINERSRRLVESQRSRIRARSSSPSPGQHVLNEQYMYSASNATNTITNNYNTNTNYTNPTGSYDYYAFHGVPERYKPPAGKITSKDFLRGDGLSKRIQMHNPTAIGAAGSRDGNPSNGDVNYVILRGLNQLVRKGISKYKLKSTLSGSNTRESSPNNRSFQAVHVKSTFDERLF